jgi:exonuclease III
MEHLMSSKVFPEWESYCSKNKWEDPKDTSSKPKHLTYCNALGGKTQSGKDESLPLRSLDAYAKKVQALLSARQKISSDLFALQEVGDADAVAEIFPPEEFNIIYFAPQNPEDVLAQNIAFAVSKSGAVKVLKSAPYNELGITSYQGRKIRPGLELIADVQGTQIAFLNVHLKASCRSKPLGNETQKNDCGDFRKQVPALESWIEKQAIAKREFMILGDWNRTVLASDRPPNGQNYDLKYPARMDGHSQAKAPLTPQTSVGSLVQEISDYSPEGATLTVVESKVSARKKKVVGEEWDRVCHLGIDHFALSPGLLKRYGTTQMQATGRDYGDNAYGLDKAKPSDHCPLTLDLPF